MLHTREFTVNGQKIIMGHDRETGKRYYIDSNGNEWLVNRLNVSYFREGENYISIGTEAYSTILFMDIENPGKIIAELKSIFWIE